MNLKNLIIGFLLLNLISGLNSQEAGHAHRKSLEDREMRDDGHGAGRRLQIGQERVHQTRGQLFGIVSKRIQQVARDVLDEFGTGLGQRKTRSPPTPLPAPPPRPPPPPPPQRRPVQPIQPHIPIHL